MKNIYTLLVCLVAFATAGFSQTPVYNSYPGAAATIFLDFDGHTVNGTSWNVFGPIVCGPSNLSSAQATEVFNRVAEDYRPFNINVTTDSVRYWQAPATQRIRVLLTITSDWYGTAGGVAMTGSFTWGNNTPCFIFTALHRYNVKNIAEAASHEVGHTLGLRHQAEYNADCIKKSDYYAGVGSGEIGWAPIMGVGYYRNLTTWHNGPNPNGCNNEQDDLALITGPANGFGYRTDDHAAGTAQATSLPVREHRMEAEGLIGTSTDLDVFGFTVEQNGQLNLDILPYSVGPSDVGANLDLQVQLIGAGQQVLGTYNPAQLLSASIDTVLNAGTYYLAVSGTSNMYTSNYASLGAYRIEGYFNEFKVLPLRRLVLGGARSGNGHYLTWTVEADEAIVQQVLEAAVAGQSFAPVATLSGTERTARYAPAAAGTLHYRLKVTLQDGSRHYSNTIVLQQQPGGALPRLQSNVITRSITVTSPADFAYSLTDLHGRVVRSGRVSEGTTVLDAGALPHGLYIICFSRDGSRAVEKIMKQ